MDSIVKYLEFECIKGSFGLGHFDGINFVSGEVYYAGMMQTKSGTLWRVFADPEKYVDVFDDIFYKHFKRAPRTSS